MEKIQVGAKEDEVRTVCSGMVGKVPIEDMSGLCIVVTNLKARKMKGIKSEAMVLAAVGARQRLLLLLLSKTFVVVVVKDFCCFCCCCWCVAVVVVVTFWGFLFVSD